MATRAGRQLLRREDWTAAALDALAREGVAGVAVDRLARRLGASRGSFYWHFRDRRELVDAALEAWERTHTTELIAEAADIADPAARLRAVFAEVYERPVDEIEVALAATAQDPVVAPTFARVTRTRIAFLTRIFADLGLPDDDAAARAWLAYAFYIGHHTLGRGDELAADRPQRLDAVLELLLSPAAAARPPRG